jgi:NAD(P)-dependent dehydrogenase (short-subunit alcohol dehydrogenase family)
MSLNNANVLIYGGSGLVAGAAALGLLREGASVVLSSRSQGNLDKAKAALVAFDAGYKDKISLIVGDASTDEGAEQIFADAEKIAPVNHAVVSFGFTVTEGGPGELATEDHLKAFSNDYKPNFASMKAAFSKLKDVEGATITLTNGGLGHGVFMLPAWTVSIKVYLSPYACMRTRCAHF